MRKHPNASLAAALTGTGREGSTSVCLARAHHDVRNDGCRAQALDNRDRASAQDTRPCHSVAVAALRSLVDLRSSRRILHFHGDIEKGGHRPWTPGLRPHWCSEIRWKATSYGHAWAFRPVARLTRSPTTLDHRPRGCSSNRSVEVLVVADQLHVSPVGAGASHEIGAGRLPPTELHLSSRLSGRAMSVASKDSKGTFGHFASSPVPRLVGTRIQLRRPRRPRCLR